MYSLGNAPVLAYDLARTPYGAAVAGALQRALRLEPADLPVLSRGYVGDDERTAAWDELEAACGRRARAAAALAEVRESFGSGGPTALHPAQRRGRAPLENLADLVRFVRADVLEWTWRRAGDLRLETAPHAVAVVCDGVAACYAGTAISPAAFTRLRLPWTTALRALDAARPYRERGAEFGPQTTAVRRMAGRLATAAAVELAALDAAFADAGRGGLDWSASMHSAAWAVELSDRLRPAAAAQLAAIRALPIAGDAGAASLAGVVGASSAAIQATVVADLLDDHTAAALTGPWRRVFGPID